MMNTTFCIVAIITAIACAHAFSYHANLNAIRHEQGCRSRHHHHNFLLSKQFHIISPIVRKAAESDEVEDDDGWGTTPTSVDRVSKSQELARLQDEMTMKKQQNNKSSQISFSNNRIEKEERDLFIPIFALVSVLGFTGLYGYEMLRLYSRGELYLPWNN